MAKKTQETAQQIVDEMARDRAYPGGPGPGPGKKLITGDVWYDDVWRRVGRSNKAMFHDVCEGLSKRGFWVHS